MNDARLEQLLAGRYIATLATWSPDDSIYLSAVWFLHHDGAILVATAGTTRKARNASRRADGSILIDARGRGPLRGAAATGVMEILTGTSARDLNERIWRKYLTGEGLRAPGVGGAIRSHDDVTIRLVPDGWRTWGTDDDFGGALEEPGVSLPLDE